MARSIFNGTLRIEDVSIPVKLYSAVEPRGVSFRLLHAPDRVPIRQRMVHPETGDEVPLAAARKGVVLPGGMVMLSDEELTALEPKSSRDIEVLRFVDPARLNHQWYARPYFLGPAGEPKAYYALVRALAQENREGIVRWTMRKKVYHGALRAIDDALVLITLRPAAEVVAVEALPELSWPKPSEAEMKMARQLVEMLEAELDWEQFHDRYAEEVATLAEAKSEGHAPELPEVKQKPAREVSLADALAASIARLEERDVA
jgi:DNA end-binding protein Ku